MNKINKNDSLFNILNTNEDSQLITLIVNDNVDFLGKVSYRNKQLIKKALYSNEYYEIEHNTYKIILYDTIYLFKKYEKNNKTILVGIIADKTEKNRFALIDKQMDHLLKKSENW
jgi:hypothetical protein